MAANSSIEWTDATWNPVTGCCKVSPGCAHCYAETVALRFWPTQYPKITDKTSKTFPPYQRDRMFHDVLCHEDRLDQPLKWRKPRRIFVNSMSDLFHEDVPDNFIDKVFAVMALSSRHTFQVLTKRAERMRDYMTTEGRRYRVDEASAPAPCGDWPWPLPNVWLGVSVENQRFADERIPLLLQTPAAVRFISAEPLLGPVDLNDIGDCLSVIDTDADRQIDWVIVGGESGPGARPCDLAWARSIVQQCQSAGVPVFVKQLGAVAQETFDRTDYDPSALGAGWMRIRQNSSDGAAKWFRNLSLANRKGGDPAEWPADLRVRDFPQGACGGGQR